VIFTKQHHLRPEGGKDGGQIKQILWRSEFLLLYSANFSCQTKIIVMEEKLLTAEGFPIIIKPKEEQNEKRPQ
jgi:hypothetical protein